MTTDLAFPVLIADIGGTNARFAVIAAPGEPYRLLAEVETRTRPSLAAAIEADVLPVTTLRPAGFVFAVAGPVRGDRIVLTNCPWDVVPPALVARFGLAGMTLFNDFEALSLALPSLGAGDLLPLGAGLPPERGAKVVVGPGTGLGAAGLLDVAGRWVPVGGEGGHVTLAPETERELAIWSHIERPAARVSAETLISGAGLLRLYRALAMADGVAPAWDHPESVTRAAKAGEPRAQEAVALFTTWLGRVAGDLALVFLARGGVYIGGGIPAKLAPLMPAAAFRAAFETKPPHEALLASIATAVITHPHAALVGLAAFAAAPGRFLLDLDHRHWTAG